MKKISPTRFSQALILRKDLSGLTLSGRRLFMSSTSKKSNNSEKKSEDTKWYEKKYTGADLAWRKQVAWAISLAIVFIFIPLFSNILGRKWADDKQKKTLEG